MIESRLFRMLLSKLPKSLWGNLLQQKKLHRNVECRMTVERRLTSIRGENIQYDKNKECSGRRISSGNSRNGNF